MSVLLRHPAIVPALFSGAAETIVPTAPVAVARGSRGMSAPLLALSGWAAVMLSDMPLVKAATATVGLALPR